MRRRGEGSEMLDTLIAFKQQDMFRISSAIIHPEAER